MWTIDDRYKYTYDRKTYNWDNNNKLRTLIETMNTLRATAVSTNNFTALKTFLTDNFDVQKMIDYIAIRNWAEPWDEGFHNFFLYQRASDGKWLMIPQDKDREFGEQYSWVGGRSFFVGEEGNGQYNRFKDAIIKCFRNELRAESSSWMPTKPQPDCLQSQGLGGSQLFQHHRLRIVSSGGEYL